VVDDDLDLEMDMDSTDPQRRRRPAKPAAPPPTPKSEPQPAPAKPPATAEAAAEPATAASEEVPPKKVKVVPSSKKGFLSRLADSIAGLLAKIPIPQWNLRNFAIGLVALIALLLVVENWPSIRLSFLGLHADVPKSLVLIIALAAGFGIGSLVFRRKDQAPRAQASD